MRENKLNTKDKYTYNQKENLKQNEEISVLSSKLWALHAVFYSMLYAMRHAVRL